MEGNRGARRNGHWGSARPTDGGRRSRSQRPVGSQPETSIFQLAQQQHDERNRDQSTASNGSSKSRRRSPQNGTRFNNDTSNRANSGDIGSRDRNGRQNLRGRNFSGGHGSRFNNEPRNEEDSRARNLPEGHGSRFNNRQRNEEKAMARNLPEGHGSRFNNRDRNEGRDPQGGNFSRPETKRLYPMGYKALERLLTKPPGEVIFSVKSSKTGFKELLNSDEIDKNKLVMCLHAIALACGTDHTENLKDFLKLLLDECQQFLSMRLVRYLIETQSNPSNMYQLNSMTYILDLIETFQSTVAQESLFTTQLLIPHVAATITRLHSEIGHGLELIKRVEKIEETKTQLLDRFTIIYDATRQEEDKVPNDFREIPIFPDKHDLITNQRPFLRPNVIEGRYLSADHYLDVQFRLLREDFVRPLREGIAVYQDQIRNNRRQRLQDIKVYQDVTITKIILSDNGVLHEVKFNTAQLGNVRWERSKRLIYGALVCLTLDNFETVYFGTVGDRQIDKLSQGLIAVKFEKQDEILNVQLETFTMVETEAYFEASRHILSALQSINEKHFPMKEYIVELQKHMTKPQYLTDDSVYCLRSIAKGDSLGSSSSSFDFDNSRRNLNANCSCMLQSKSLSVGLFRNGSWPTPDELNLDHSQFDALKSALTQKLSIIQGPPGTGKTHVGLKIMEVLLHNQSSWNTEIDNEEKNPILVVCFTNHALDQFLEGVLKLTHKIVRMGGRSESEKLKPFQMNNLKRIMARSRTGDNYVGRYFKDMKYELETILNAINSKERTLKTCEREILSEIDLRNEISDALSDSFYLHAPKFLKLSNRDMGKVLKYWLGINIPDHLHSIPDENALIVHDLDEPHQVPVTPEVQSDPESDQDSEGEIDVNVSDYEDVEENLNEVVAPIVIPPPIINAANGADDNLHDDVGAAAPAPVNVAEFEYDPEYDYDPEDINYIMDQRMDDNEEYRNARVVILNKSESDDEVIPQNDTNEWKTQGGKKRQRKYLKSQLGRFTVLSDDELLHTRNIWSLKMEDRWRLYKTWLALFIQNETEKIDNFKKYYDKKLATFGEMKTEEEIIVARSALVIGMTTTGAAKYRHLVRNLKSKIVIVEEAAEVLEAQIVTSLSKYTEHVILIGDHQQLRPNPTVYDLAKKYHLEISLFERLIKNGIPFVRLGIQHRMKPSISRLLVPHIYDKLEDHSSVHEYEEILGFEKSVFFVSHQHFELKDNDSTTRINMHEAQFLVSLCRYILQQGYEPSQITILTTYLGQLFTLKRLLNGHLQEVRATVVDNYQGEENDIILLSFVRSNEQGVIGFLKTDNRVCVALSRAKKALFCIGNFDSFSQGSPLWENITQELSRSNAIGPALNLRCQIHKNVETMSSAFDFNKVPDGGCSLPCDFRLLCGHVCVKKCHPFDREHGGVKCQKPCERIHKNCEFEHKCRKRCHEDCGPCMVMVLKTIPKCNHLINVPCHVDENSYKCTYPCPKMLACGHKCATTCGDVCGDCHVRVNVLGRCGHEIRIECVYSENESQLKQACRERCPLILACGHHCRSTCGKPCPSSCKENVQVTLPCEHLVRTTCDNSKDINQLQQLCLVKCGALLECEHQCSGTCGKCYQGRLHVLCNRKCQKILVCGHPCAAPCSASCPPCKKLCENKCPHSGCPQKCGFPCPPCQEKCKWGCMHFQCTANCGEPCNRPPCNKYCNKKLRCRHKCVGMCGEPCPRLCRICNRDELQQLFFGNEGHPQARYIELEDCKHVVEIRGLTKWVKTQLNADGAAIKVLECPICTTPIRKNLRFGNQVKMALAKIEKVKVKIFGKIDENGELQKRLKSEVEKFLDETVPRQYIRASRTRYNYFHDCTSPLVNELTHGKPVLDSQTLTSIENVLMILKALVKVQVECLENNVELSHETLDQLRKDVQAYGQSLAQNITLRMEQSVHVSAQFLTDLQMETTRWQNVGNILKDFGKTRVHGSQQFKERFDSVVTELLRRKPFTEKDLVELNCKKKELMKLSDGVVLGISEEERVAIVNAMGFKQGHWYTCPNGHVYCIADCGGAMVVSRCNECGAHIGGQNHALTTGNRHAGAMDRSSHAAWSEQANMGNYQI